MKISPTDLILNLDGSVYHLNLLPENIADTIITVGDPDRVEKVSRYFDSVDFRMSKREFVTHTGTINKKRISVISTGIGTDNVEIFFNEIDALVNVDLKTREIKSTQRRLSIIRIGTSGALRDDIPMGSHLISNYAVGLDNIMSFYNLEMTAKETALSQALQKNMGLSFQPYIAQGSVLLREQIGFDMMQGNTVTCPGFYGPQGRSVRLPIRFPALLDGLYKFEYDGIKFTNFEMETSGYYAFGRLLGHDVVSANAILANRITKEFAKNPDEVVDALIKNVLERI